MPEGILCLGGLLGTLSLSTDGEGCGDSVRERSPRM